jgi:aerobic carbon-monoxide dehydrogenase small subunit
VANIRVTVNGQEYQAEAESRMLLIHFLRDVLRLTGPHSGCVVGRCGACTVLWNGKAVKSCMVYAVQVDGSELLTVEGLAQGGQLHPLQEAFWDNDAAECGFCTPGMLMSAYALLSNNSAPTTDDIKQALAGNICRCTGYVNIIKAVHVAAESLAGSKDPAGVA